MLFRSKYEHSLGTKSVKDVGNLILPECIYSYLDKNNPDHSDSTGVCSKCTSKNGQVIPIVISRRISSKEATHTRNPSELLSKRSLSYKTRSSYSRCGSGIATDTRRKYKKLSPESSSKPLRKRTSHSANTKLVNTFAKISFEQVKKAKSFSEKAVMVSIIFFFEL